MHAQIPCGPGTPRCENCFSDTENVVDPRRRFREYASHQMPPIALMRGLGYLGARVVDRLFCVRRSPRFRNALNVPVGTAGDEVALWRWEAALGSAWRFSRDDMPHFVHRNGRWWLVHDEAGRWEAWLGHRLIGRFDTLRNAKTGLYRAIRF